MRYHLESYLPVEAFKPRGGVFGSGGMTLHGGGGGGGGFLAPITNTFSGVGNAIGSVLGTDGGGGGILGGLADFDKSVASSVKGGWGGLAETAAVIAASYFGGPLGAAAARGAFDYTHGGEDRKNALRNAAEQAAVSYAGQYGGALGAGAAKTGLEYTHGGADRENAPKSGAIAAGTQLALQGAKDYFDDTSGIEGGMNNEFGSGTSGYGEANEPLNSNVSQTPSGNYVSDYSAPAPDGSVQVDPFRPDISAPDLSASDIYDDGYSPNVDSDYVKLPGETGFNMVPADSLILGQSPTSYIPTDMPPGTQLEGPNGTEIVAPNGKTYLMKDLESAYLNSQTEATPYNAEAAPYDATPEILTNIADTNPKSILNNDDAFKEYEKEFGTTKAQLDRNEAERVFEKGMQDTTNRDTTNYAGEPRFTEDPLKYLGNQAQDAKTYLGDKAINSYKYLRDTDISKMGKDAYDLAMRNKLETAALGYGLYNVLGSKPQPQPQPQGSSDDSSGPYTGGYGSAGITSNPYLLRNRVNAQNVYGYSSPISRYADGGEVKHFGLGGLSNAVTRFTQPFEKAILQPIGNAAPFLRDAAPYAGLIAAPFIASPAMAAGVGALSSGFGNRGSGFNMKRAMMGGIAAYGMSNIGAGIEAAGGGSTTPIVDNIGESYAVPGTEIPKTGSTGFFRDTDAMGTGIKNLAGGSTYKPAAAQFLTEAGLPSAGMTVMGTSGVMAIDEGIEQQKAADAAAAMTKGENQEMLNRIAAGKKRAQEAVKAYPYMYAVGGSVDDEYGMDEARGLMQGNLQNGFMGGIPSYAAGGMQQFATGGTPRFLSGGGDGMSDSIPATIEGNQEARLADGEFVIPADVVSHLGNGSSKAGAKQLYSMMDRVRQARVGTKQQGKAIKPKKFMPV